MRSCKFCKFCKFCIIMIIGGLEKLTLIDFPGELACIIFTKGCNFRCQFCYNPMLVWPREDGKLQYAQSITDGAKKDHSFIEEGDLFVFLESRRGKLGGVVITGGEPTIYPDLPGFIKKIKAFGFKVKLDTNGTNPDMLAELVKNTGESGLKLIDYLAMDIKAPLDKYEIVAGVALNLEKIKKSIEIIMNSGISYEFRTTLVPGLHTIDDIKKMGELILGADKWFLQFFKSDTELVNHDFEGKRRFAEKEMNQMVEIGRGYVKKCEVRG